MTALTAKDVPAEAEKMLAKLRELNAANAYIAAVAMTNIVERLAIEGNSTADVELARKILESLQKVAVHPEKQEAGKVASAVATAFLEIVTDRSVKQVPPPKKPALVDVSDAVMVVPVATPAEEAWGLA
jgi:hypothetical protein